MLTNAIYFKADWQAQFNKSQKPRRGGFPSLIKANRESAADASQRRVFARISTAAASKGWKYPYREQTTVDDHMFTCPSGRTGLPTLEGAITPDAVNIWLSQFRPVPEVIVTLPKFRVKTQFELDDVLHAMGMKQAFGPGADFSGMASKGNHAAQR